MMRCFHEGLVAEAIRFGRMRRIDKASVADGNRRGQKGRVRRGEFWRARQGKKEASGRVARGWRVSVEFATEVER